MNTEAAPTPKTPYETLLTLRPFQVVEFLDGVSAIRNVLNSRNSRSNALIVPLRGALPLLWASEGVHGLESPLQIESHEVALGLFHYTNRRGEIKTTSPSYSQKATLLKELIDTHLNDRNKRILLLDEVQKGGTISASARILHTIFKESNPTFRLGLIAAQDSRLPVMRQPKTQMYEQIASNSFDSIKTNVIPLPLIATDRDTMLDTVYLSGNYQDNSLSSNRFTVVRNSRAESMFRVLGTIARQSEVRHDTTFISDFIDSQGRINEALAAKTEFWIPKLLEYLDDTAKNLQ